MGTDQYYPKAGFAENKVTLGSQYFYTTRNITITHGKNIPWKQTTSTQNLDSHNITLHWATIFVPNTSGLHMGMIFHGYKSRLLKIWIRRKYDYTGPQYVRP